MQLTLCQGKTAVNRSERKQKLPNRDYLPNFKILEVIVVFLQFTVDEVLDVKLRSCVVPWVAQVNSEWLVNQRINIGSWQPGLEDLFAVLFNNHLLKKHYRERTRQNSIYLVVVVVRSSLSNRESVPFAIDAGVKVDSSLVRMVRVVRGHVEASWHARSLPDSEKSVSELLIVASIRHVKNVVPIVCTVIVGALNVNRHFELRTSSHMAVHEFSLGFTLEGLRSFSHFRAISWRFLIAKEFKYAHGLNWLNKWNALKL